jgi:SAM-dependent methyltransferase
MQNRNIPGLDFDFLQFIGVLPENQRRIHGFYLPFFANCRKVVDLGSGNGSFVELLREHGIDAEGVDSDPKACQAAAERGIPVVQSDALDYLEHLPARSIDGIFCAHLVEHLAYPQVIDLIRSSLQALQPGGTIVLATPNVRSLFSHLEMFYLHFGHVTFYHPRLLCFFLQNEGFVDIQSGENPEIPSPMLPAVGTILSHYPPFTAVAPPQRQGALHRLSYQIRRRLADWLVRLLMGDLRAQAVRLDLLQDDLRSLAESLQALNGAFECYAIARRPDAMGTVGG